MTISEFEMLNSQIKVPRVRMSYNAGVVFLYQRGVLTASIKAPNVAQKIVNALNEGRNLVPTHLTKNLNHIFEISH